MYRNLLDKQKKDALFNYNYFFIIMIVKVFKTLIILASILLINQIFDILIINIITLILSICSIIIIYKIVGEYNYILNDIKNTFKDVNFSFIIDTNIVKNQFSRKVVKYGK